MSNLGPYSNVQRPQKRANAIDIREIMNKEIRGQRGSDAGEKSRAGSVSGFNTQIVPSVSNQLVATSQHTQQQIQPIQQQMQQVQQVQPKPVNGFEDAEIYFDSVQRDASSDVASGEVKWNIPSMNAGLDIKNCIQMRIGAFYFPKIYATSGKPEYFYYNRVYIEFQNSASSNAIIASNNNRFHFEFEISNTSSQAILLTPTKDTFFFQRPISSITDFQLRFLVPPTNLSNTTYKRVPIPKDTIYVTSALTTGVGYNPIRFTVNGSDDTTCLGPIGAVAETGVAVFISSYASNDSATNTAVNSTEGVFVTNIISLTQFEISGINASAVTAAYTATVYIPKNRIAMPIRFTSVRDTVTNYITVGHQ
jgi:hypothetical protein